jgi:hypothetical protein
VFANGERRVAPPETAATKRLPRDFSRIPVHSQATVLLQTKLVVNTPGDVYEQEADRAAELVTKMSNATALAGLWRQGSPACETPHPSLLRQTISKTDPGTQFAETGVPALVQTVLAQAGNPLDAATRNFMEPRFGFDFSRVRLHTGSAAALSAKTVNARAFTVGNDIVFGEAQYAHGSQASQSLLAHELAHVVQQSRSAGNENLPTIQRRQGHGAGTVATAGPGADPDASLRQAYVELACEVIASIRQAVEEGRTWEFEDEFLLQGEEWLQVGQPTRVQERRDALMRLVRDLDSIIGDLDSGRVTPTEPASRDALWRIWGSRHPSISWLGERVPVGQPPRWSPPLGSTRLPSGGLRRMYPSMGNYIHASAGSPPGMLQPADFPTWWVSCPTREPAPSIPDDRITPTDLFPPNAVIFVGRTGDVVTNWTWEPRRTSIPPDQGEWHCHRELGCHPVALGTPYAWHYDEAAGRVFIIVNGQRVNLLRNGRVEIQR